VVVVACVLSVGACAGGLGSLCCVAAGCLLLGSLCAGTGAGSAVGG
jgi:hypothetical protein